MVMGLETLTAATVSVPDCVPIALVAPVVTALTGALVYQTRNLSKAATKTEELVDKLLQEVLKKNGASERTADVK